MAAVEPLIIQQLYFHFILEHQSRALHGIYPIIMKVGELHEEIYK